MTLPIGSGGGLSGINMRFLQLQRQAAQGAAELLSAVEAAGTEAGVNEGCKQLAKKFVQSTTAGVVEISADAEGLAALSRAIKPIQAIVEPFLRKDGGKFLPRTARFGARSGAGIIAGEVLVAVGLVIAVAAIIYLSARWKADAPNREARRVALELQEKQALKLLMEQASGMAGPQGLNSMPRVAR